MVTINMTRYLMGKIDEVALKSNKNADDFRWLRGALEKVEDFYGIEMRELVVFKYNIVL